MAHKSPEDVWNSYKELKTIVWNYLNQGTESDLPSADLENILRRHKHNFFALLQNPSKSTVKREELKNAMVEGINVKGLGHQILSRELFQEAIILSDMFDLNEFVALDLLCTAQIQMPYYPGLTRGLVAVILYYDGRKALLTTLQYLVQARSGIQWSVNIKPELSRFVTEYTNQLMEGGLFNRIFDLLRALDLSKEIEKLQENLALGGPKHRRQVTDLFNDIRKILADIVFSWATQCGLPKDPTLGLINYLRQVKIESEATGVIDNVNLYLQMALLCAFDLSVFHTREDGEEVVQSLPILSDTSFISCVVNEFLPTNPKWVSEGLQALSTFGLSVCLASLRVVPQNYIFQDSINKEDTLVDTSIEMNVFMFIHNVLLENQTLYKERFFYKRMHNLLTDFIVYMYTKVKDLRMKANEVSRTLQVYIREGLEAPSNLPRYFETLLLCIGKFYTNNILDPEYTLSWWSPIEINPHNSLNIRSSPRSVALFKFVKLAGDMLPSTLFVPFIKMLSGLSVSKEAARHCFNTLKQPGVHLCHTLSWDHFFTSFGQYYNNLRQETPPQADTVYRLRSGYHKGVSPQELEGLHAVLLLIRTVAENDAFARLALCEHPGWSPLTILLGLVSCSVPILLKADLLLTLSSLAKSSENASQMWDNLEASQILVTIPTTSSYAPRGIQTELDEIESRMEEYPLTQAVLKLLDTLTDFGIPRTLGAGPRKPGFDPYLSFILNCVFLKYNSRPYRDGAEKWDVAYLCLKLFEKFLRQYEPKITDFPKNASSTEFNSPPGYHLMLQLNNKTETLNVILDIIDEGNRFFDAYVSFQGQEKVRKCSLASLAIIYRVLVLQNGFFGTLTLTSASIFLTNISKLLLTINRRSGKPDHCINIAKYVSYHQYLPRHALAAVKILVHITSTPNIHNQFMNILLSMEEMQEIIKTGFFQCLDAKTEDVEAGNATKKEILKLLKQCLAYTVPNLTHFLLGFDWKRDVSKTEFQYPGVLGFPRTCLHSMLSLLDSAVSKIVESPPSDLVESAYHLLYLLASNSKTSGPVLRFVRLNKLFFPIHLKECQKHMNKGSKFLKQVTWLMKTLAIELKVASNTKQVTYLKQLTCFLGNVPSACDGQENLFLHEILQVQLKDLKDVPDIDQNSGAPVRSPKAMKQYNLKLRKYADACATVIEFIDSWRQVTEVFVCFMPVEILDAKEQQIFSISILRCLLKKVKGAHLLPEVARLLSGSVLLMMDNIKRHYLKEQKNFNVLTYYLGSLKEILELLVDWIIVSDVVDGELRMSLYAALVTFLQLTDVEPEHQEIVDTNSMYVSRLDGSRYNVEFKDKQLKLSTDIVGNFGEKLMEVLCHDCIGGQEVCKILALSSFSHLMIITGNSSWVIYLSSRGYLKHIIQSILDSDQELKAMLEPGSGNMKAVYLYLAKILLLVRLASSKVGAELILEQKLLGVFSNMTVYSCHPEISKVWLAEESLEDFLPSPEQQYLQIFLPTLEICNAILTTLGTENQSAVVQIMHFLFSHLDVVELVLRSGHVDLSPTSLKELALLTSVISRTATNNLINVLENPNIVESNRAELYRIQKLMLNLIPKFIMSEENTKRVVFTQRLPTLLMQTLARKPFLSAPGINEKNAFQISDRLLYAMQIASNLLWYARNIVANNDIEHGEVGVVFYPTLNDPKLHTFQTRTAGYSNEQETSLGAVVQQLINTVNYQHQGKVTYGLLERKIKELPDMNSLDLREYLEGNMEMCDLAVKRESAYEIILDRLEKKKKEMDYCAFIIENSLYLIWAHLDYFMLRAVPNPRNTSYVHPNLSSSNLEVALPTTPEALWKVSTEMIGNLRQGLVSLFNDSFSKQLLETSQDRTEADRGFVEALLRKIKRLIQFVRAT